MRILCDTCGKEVDPQEGTLSWIDNGNSLRDFKITHKTDQNHQCDPRDIAYIHLWIVTGLTGFVKFTELLAGHWAKGYTLEDAPGLKRALSLIGAHIWESTKKKE